MHIPRDRATAVLYFTVALVAAAALAITSINVATAYEVKSYTRYEKKYCMFGPFQSDARVRDLIRCAHKMVGETGDTSMSLMIANNESGYEPKAKNPSSSAGGLYQWLKSSWPAKGGRYNTLYRVWRLEGKRFNARAAAFVSAKVMAGPGGFGPWCGFTSYC